MKRIVTNKGRLWLPFFIHSHYKFIVVLLSLKFMLANYKYFARIKVNYRRLKTSQLIIRRQELLHGKLLPTKMSKLT